MPRTQFLHGSYSSLWDCQVIINIWQISKTNDKSFDKASDKEDIPWPIWLQELQSTIYIQGYWKVVTGQLKIIPFF